MVTHRNSVAETIIDKALECKYIGGVYGNQRPTEYICLLLKLLQIQPEKEILVEYLRADEFKCVCVLSPGFQVTNWPRRYLRALAALYIRMTFDAVEVYELLEPLMKDYRKLRVRSMGARFAFPFPDRPLTFASFVSWILAHVHRRIRLLSLDRRTRL